eukprot:759757-Hanusia_phi.AAC.2
MTIPEARRRLGQRSLPHAGPGTAASGPAKSRPVTGTRGRCTRLHPAVFLAAELRFRSKQTS